jgi:RND family efflux transporter MFP subunit
MPARVFIRFVLPALVVVALVFAARRWLEQTAIVVPVERADAPNAAPGTVTVAAERSAEVRSEVSGRVVESALELAGSVQAGDLLVQLDTSEVEIQIARDESEIAAARRRLEIGNPATHAQLLAARDALVLNEELFAKGNVAQLTLDRSRREVAQLEQQTELDKVNLAQQVAALESNLALNRRRLALMTIRAPIGGVVAEVRVGEGDLVNSGATIARITSAARVVEAKVSEENFAGVQIGQEATVRFTQYGSWLWKGRVSRILPEADPQTQRYRVHLDVEIEPEKLVPGITGEVSILLDLHENALVIPRVALVGDTVFVVDGGVVERRRVEVGFTSLNAVEILAGVEEGELVIVDELDRFRDGDRVRVVRRSESTES